MRIADYKIANEMMEILYSATENKVNEKSYTLPI